MTEEDKSPLDPVKEAHLTRLFEDLPEGFEERYAALKGLRSAFHRKIARALGPALNRKIAGEPAGSLQARRGVTAWVDVVTRELGVCPAHPETGEPALLIADTFPSTSELRYVLLVRHGPRTMDKTTVGKATADFGLMEAPVNIESLFQDIRPVSFGGRARRRR